MQHMIDGFEIFPGDHCGSVAMRGLLHHYSGLSLPEHAVFGLGAGVTSAYLHGPGLDPRAFLIGRTHSMELDLGRHLGLDYREQTEADDDQAWQVVREEVLAGRPTMLAGDIFYLDYRDFKVHFPGHRFILLGFDDENEKAFIADRVRDVPETCSLGAVARARNAPEGLSTENLWGRFHDPTIGSELRDAAESAIRQCAQGMLSPPEVEAGVELGLAGSRAFAAALPGFCEAEDARWIASFNASCIEKFGNGGGNFRRLYAGFLGWARELDKQLVPESAPALATEAADAWTAASIALFRASDRDGDQAAWDEAATHVDRATDLETTLFTGLAEAVG